MPTGTEEFCGVQAEALQSGITVSGLKRSGTLLNYTTNGWDPGTWSEEEQSGNFLAFKLAGANNQARLPSGHHITSFVSDPAGEYVFRLDATSKQGGIEVKDDTGTKLYDLSGLVLQT